MASAESWVNAIKLKPQKQWRPAASTIGTLNPFRYRGYVYDEETGLYYLQSRYYDPELCRFISSDVLLSTGQGVLGCNSFAYCENSPVSFFDKSGFRSEAIDPGEISGVPFGMLLESSAVIGIASLISKENMINLFVPKVDPLSVAALAALSSALARVGQPKKYRRDYEDHHIVLQHETSPSMVEARRILEEVSIKIDSPENVISLPTSFHRSIHNNIYKIAISYGVISAYYSGGFTEIGKRAAVSTLAT